MTIKQKLISAFLLVAVMIGIVGYISVNTSEKLLYDSIFKSSVTLAIETLDKIDRSVYYRIKKWRSYAYTSLRLHETLSRSNEEFENLSNRQEYINEIDIAWKEGRDTAFTQNILNNSLSQQLNRKIEFHREKGGYNVFPEVFVTNKYGVVIASTGRTSDYLQADELWYQKAMLEKEFRVGEVEYDESSDVYACATAINLYDNNGNFAGMIKVILNIESIIDILKELETNMPYRTTEYKLLTKDQKFIYSSGEFNFLQDLPTKLLHPLQTSLEEENIFHFVTEDDDPDKGKALFAHAHSEGYKDYKGLDWLLLVEHQIAEIYAPVVKLRNLLLAMSFILTLSAILIGLFISYTISAPITKLKDALFRTGRGNLSTRVEIKSNDEIGLLAGSFNQMLEQIQRRDAELVDTNKQLKKEAGERELVEKSLEVLNQKLEQMVNKLSESNRELQDFVHVASHDLREPLRTISLFGQLLEDSLKEQLDEDDRENLRFIIDGASRMTQMIEAMLIFSRVGTIDIQFDNIDLNEAVKELKDLELTVLLEETGGTIFVPDLLPRVNGDAVQVRQLLQNLIANALKYHKPQTPPEVWIRADQVVDNMVRITIEDNGIGIKEEHYKDVFTMFKRLRSKSSYEGAGIGLSVCKKIIERHGGEIGVSSEFGKGTRFWFTLQAANVEEVGTNEQKYEDVLKIG